MLSAYDVANVQHLVSRLYLETLGYYSPQKMMKKKFVSVRRTHVAPANERVAGPMGSSWDKGGWWRHEGVGFGGGFQRSGSQSRS
jgi:hypothetical protein